MRLLGNEGGWARRCSTWPARPLHDLNPDSPSINPSSHLLRTSPSARRLWLWGLLLTPFLLLGLLGACVAGCFRLSADARAVRNELIKSSDVEWRQQIALNAGWDRIGIHQPRLSKSRHQWRMVKTDMVAQTHTLFRLPAWLPDFRPCTSDSRLSRPFAFLLSAFPISAFCMPISLPNLGLQTLDIRL
jgi:hypothetical protein